MTISDMIRETRKESNMTQEQYGDKFGVTRQTVSSWENGKSYPDLQTLIAICDSFDMSLDKLLREDKKLIKEVDNAKMMVKVARSIFTVLFVAILIFLLYCLAWYQVKNSKEKEFTAAMRELNFEFDNGAYVAYKDSFEYVVPNQKLPFLKFHYYSAVIDINYVEDDYRSLNLRTDGEMSFFEINGNPEKAFKTDADGKLVEKEQLSEAELDFYERYQNEIVKMAKEGMRIYSIVYE